MSTQRIPSLKLLIGFEAAARLGHFSRAADELCLSQSAISHQISDLETQLGQPLFHRVGRGVELTVAGKVLQRSVRQSIDMLQNGLSSIATYLDPGLVSLVCPAPLLHGWLQPKLDLLHAALPDLCLVLSTDETARFIDEVDVDIALGNRPIQEAGLLERPFLQDEWITVGSAALAQQLAQQPREQHHLHTGLLCLEAMLTDARTAKLFREPLGPFRKQAIYDDPRLLLDAVLRGRGIACLPRLLANDDLDQGRLVILPDYPRLGGPSWWISRVAGQPRADIVQQVFDWLLVQASISAED
ncbi:LysR family transcriptional regulator [Iodobacter sp. LRB]|uniref:LysR family transcriptional regulator n=1 Tax=unclassified Iodobacter TaxID=235634 RepID=UPI000C0E99A2|nr:LysR family transcriptional regulator [Iodobacter sp. BJB302]PHV02855.1 LysR family transcriptional regulator [Iodobacter sp. BJB302]